MACDNKLICSDFQVKGNRKGIWNVCTNDDGTQM